MRKVRYNIIGWMSRTEFSDRKNYHLDNSPDPNSHAPPIIVHVFAKNRQSPYLQDLEQSLIPISCQYQLHDINQLSSFPLLSHRKTFFVLCREGPNDTQQFQLPQSLTSNSREELVRVCILGGRGKGTIQSGRQVVEAIKAFASPPPKIKLAGVHSIRLSKDKKVESSRSLKKVVTDATYQKVFFFKNYTGDYGETHHSAYEELAQALEGQANFEPFKSSRELEKKQAPKGKRKYIVLASTNDASIRIINDLRKAKLNYFDFLLLGRLDPRESFLDDNVILASSDPNAHITFLMDNGFQSHNIQTIANRFKTQLFVAEIPNSQPFQTFQGGPIQTEASRLMSVEPAIDSKTDDEHHQKKKIKKIKSPGKPKPSQISQISPEHEELSNANIINVIISKHKDEPIIENEEFRVNKQGEKIYKQNSVKELPKDPPQQQPIVFQPNPAQASPYQPYQSTPYHQSTFYQSTPYHPSSYQSSNYFDAKTQNNNTVSSRYDATATNVESQFTAKKASNIEAKYRNPSVIIQEMSDEYRGSNKESIMNLEPEKPRNEYTPPINEPAEENTAKKIVTKATYNEPETHYISSNRTIENTITTIPAPTSPLPSAETINNTSRYASPSRVISATPITINGVSSTNLPNGVRVYGSSAAGYQSPSRVIRKQVTVPQVVEDEKPKEDNRITFGVNSGDSNSLNYSISNPSGTFSSAYRNPTSPTTNSNSNNYNYYKSHTLNYHTINNEPYNSNNKVQITAKTEQNATGKIEQTNIYKPEQIISSNTINSAQKQTEQTRIYTPSNYLPSPKVDQKDTKQFVSSTIFNNDDYEQIERDGRIIYRKKVPIEINKYTQSNYINEDDGSPTVRRYEPSPPRKDNTYAYQPTQSTATRREPVTYGGTYGRVMGGSTSTSTKGNLEIITVPYNKPEEHLGEMIESSHKKKAAQGAQITNVNSINTNSRTDGKNFVTVSYRNQDRSTVSYNKDNGVRVYGVAHPRVDVERVERVEPKVQAATPKEVISPPKLKQQATKLKSDPPKPKLQGAKPKIQLNSKAELSPIPKNTLNESNWFSRISELHSDGSILRRNNIRFGVKLQKRQQRVEGNSVLQNKLVSGIFKVNDLNKKMALNRIIQGQEYIEEEREKYAHINPSLNRFHLLLQEDMEYLHPTLANYLAHPHDRIDSFAGVHSLFATLNTHNEAFDLGFIFARQEEMAHINTSLLPQHYFLVSIEGEDGLLQISEAQRRVRVDQLRHFPLVQRIILDSQLYQYVAYRNSKPEVELLADKFVNSEFILEKIETEFTTEILDCYYYELPRLTRLYVLCDEQELPGLLAVVQAYCQVNPAFKRETCKLVCVLSNILGNDELIMAHPSVTFISNPEEVTHFRHILGYAHHYDQPDPSFIPTDHIFYHNKHAGLELQLAKQYPGRFVASPFGKVAEVYPKVQKISKVGVKHGCQPRVYLVLHENVNAQKVRVQFFSKIFMLGKAKVVQNKVVRVMNTEELLELLNK